MAQLIARLNDVRPAAERICQIAGAAGASVGVLHDGKVVLTDNFGYRDVENQITPDQDTIYYLASLSKSFTATGMAHLIHQTDNLTWDTPVSQAYSNLTHEDPVIAKRATILDFLSHRTGLAPKNHMWSQEFAQFTLSRAKGEDMQTVRYLEKIAELGTRWLYNNWGYGAADEIIEHLSKEKSFAKHLQTTIFDRLGLQRTLTKRPDDENIAKGYVCLANGSLHHIRDPDGQGDRILAGALSIRSCVRDLSVYYSAFMAAIKEEKGNATTDTDGASAFVDATKMIEPLIRISEDPNADNTAYGLAWVRASLPCPLGVLSMNHDYLGRTPVVARGVPVGTTCIYHHGTSNSFLSSVYLLPDTQSGVIVLTNSLAQNDLAEWIGELYLEALLDSPKRNNYIELAESSAKAALELWPGMAKELADSQDLTTPKRPAAEYVGRYYNRIGLYHMDILEENGELLLRFQRSTTITYPLKHHHNDTFSWLLTHDRNAEVGRFPVTRASFYLIEFISEISADSPIDRLIWIHDDEVLEGETFFKRADKGASSDKPFLQDVENQQHVMVVEEIDAPSNAAAGAERSR